MVSPISDPFSAGSIFHGGTEPRSIAGEPMVTLPIRIFWGGDSFGMETVDVA